MKQKKAGGVGVEPEHFCWKSAAEMITRKKSQMLQES